jgi:hypothetical protein
MWRATGCLMAAGTMVACLFAAPQPASAAALPTVQAGVAETAPQLTEKVHRRRYYGGRRVYRRGYDPTGAAIAGAALGVMGAVAARAAAPRRDYYYYGGPGYYYGPPRPAYGYGYGYYPY